MSRQTEYRARNRVFIKSLKNVPCLDCGGRFHPEAMHFDHLDPALKYMNIGVMFSHSREHIEQEVAKCEIVCANCHAVRSYNRRNIPV